MFIENNIGNGKATAAYHHLRLCLAFGLASFGQPFLLVLFATKTWGEPSKEDCKQGGQMKARNLSVSEHADRQIIAHLQNSCP